ncbi:retromer complex subunit Vps35 [Entomophthora muscae]|uniref:Retromer complex subunit Vps35 n=1 Tax=Entomophthora muscae TaxID=34485 RepID=A0ACC2SHE8_9FUNG|nr:retromer complex subunit Vps35 [Entomophthora muscae]
MNSKSAYGDEQQKKLDEALSVVNKQASLMKRCLESSKLMDGLKHCSSMLSELRSSALSPKHYYELYMAIFDHLRHMTTYLAEAHTHGLHDLSDLYELVQYAGNIIPRLYLMITVGSVYMSMTDAPIKEIMKDMMEMTRGVQHPTRGLFLRHYLSGMTKDHLPVGDKDGVQGNLQDSIDFTLSNFVEMNKLWVRLQHQGKSQDREKRTSERKELRTLVGSNLVRLSQLEGITLDIYKQRILPDLLEQIINCKDLIAQEYLMEAIIQVFQDDFHLRTLTPFLASIANLHPSLSTKNIVISFIDRLSAYASRESHSTIPDDVDLFEILWKEVQDLIEARSEMLLEDVTALLLSIAKLALSCYPDRLSCVDKVLAYAEETYTKFASSNKICSATANSNLQELLQAPIDQYSNPLTILQFDSYAPLLKMQPYNTRRAVANWLIAAMLKHEAVLDNKAHIDGVLDLISVLIQDQEDGGINYSKMPGEVSSKKGFKVDDVHVNEMTSVAKLLNLIKSDNPATTQELLQAAYATVSRGELRVMYTYPPLITSALKVCREYAHMEEKDEDTKHACVVLLRFIFMAISTLYKKAEVHNLAFRLFLAAALAADELDMENQAYDFFVQAFLFYEERISESKEQMEAIMLLIGTLQTTRVFGEDNYDVLATKCVVHGGKLLKKPDQCRAICQASRLFWVVAVPPSKSQIVEHQPLLTQRDTALCRDGARALETLQRALKIADGVMDPLVHFELFVEILNHYLYFFTMGCDPVNARYINGLLELIKTHLEDLAVTNDPVELTTPSGAPNLAAPLTRTHVVDYFNRTLAYIQALKASPPPQLPSNRI